MATFFYNSILHIIKWTFEGRTCNEKHCICFIWKLEVYIDIYGFSRLLQNSKDSTISRVAVHNKFNFKWTTSFR